jgi:hypothetical protein
MGFERVIYVQFIILRADYSSVLFVTFSSGLLGGLLRGYCGFLLGLNGFWWVIICSYLIRRLI